MPDGDRSAQSAAPPPRVKQHRRCRVGRVDMDAVARAAHRTLLVDRARLLLPALRLVRRAGAPDQVSRSRSASRRWKPPGRSGSSASFGIPGQIIFGHLSDRIGREWAWAIGCLGFAICYAALIALQAGTNPVLLYTMVLAQGFLGYSYTAVLGPIVAEIFEGPHFGSIFGTLMLAAVTGGAVGPWVTGLIYDHTGSYNLGVLDRAGAERCLGARDLHRGAAQGAAGGGAGGEMTHNAALPEDGSGGGT